MRAVQAYERVEGGAEYIRADGEMVDADQLLPPGRRAIEEESRQHDGRAPPCVKDSHGLLGQGTLRHPDGETARKQTHAIEDRNVEHLFGSRTEGTPPDVIHIR